MNQFEVRRPTLWTVRAVALLHAGVVSSQPVLAGLYLSGEFGALGTHESNAAVILGLSVVQLIATLVHCLAGRGPIWPTALSLALVIGETAQWAVGYDHALHIHLPLGVSVVTTQLIFTVWAFRSGSRRGRRWQLPWERQRAAEPISADI